MGRDAREMEGTKSGHRERVRQRERERKKERERASPHLAQGGRELLLLVQLLLEPRLPQRLWKEGINRERGGKREIEREREREREKETDRDRETDRERESQRQREGCVG